MSRRVKIDKVNYIPCLVNKKNQPKILENDKKGQAIFNYVEKITNDAGLNAKFAWYGNEVSSM
jgi:hypothetical protein